MEPKFKVGYVCEITGRDGILTHFHKIGEIVTIIKVDSIVGNDVRYYTLALDTGVSQIVSECDLTTVNPDAIVTTKKGIIAHFWHKIRWYFRNWYI